MLHFTFQNMRAFYGPWPCGLGLKLCRLIVWLALLNDQGSRVLKIKSIILYVFESILMTIVMYYLNDKKIVIFFKQCSFFWTTVCDSFYLQSIENIYSFKVVQHWSKFDNLDRRKRFMTCHKAPIWNAYYELIK